jgi:hypothetical protein
MASGTSTYQGLAVPINGEAVITQTTAATDILTIQAANSGSGDYLVLKDSGGNEDFYVTSAGVATFAVKPVFSAGATFTGGAVDLTVSSTTATNYGIKLTLGASAVAAAAIQYDSGITGTCTAFFQVNGSLAPSYLLSVGGSAAGVGAAADNGFFEAATRFISAPSTALTYGAVKILAGSKCYYLLAIPDTGMQNT